MYSARRRADQVSRLRGVEDTEEPGLAIPAAKLRLANDDGEREGERQERFWLCDEPIFRSVLTCLARPATCDG